MKALFVLCLWCFSVFIVVNCEQICANGTADCRHEYDQTNVTATTVIPPDTRPGSIFAADIIASSTTESSSNITPGSINSTTPGPTTSGIGRAMNFNDGGDGIANSTVTPEKGSLQDLSLDDIDETSVLASTDKTAVSSTEDGSVLISAETWANATANGSCVENGVYYSKGQHFFKGCDAACTCEDNGNIRCVPRCEGPFFRRGMERRDPTCVEKLVDDPCCAILVCSHDTETEPLEECTYMNRTYKRGDTIQDGCNEVCTCGAAGKLSCKPRCPKIANNTSDHCVVVPDPADACCKVILCDVSVTDHDSTKTDTGISNLRLLETEVVNSTSIRLGLAGDPPDNLTLESSIDQNTWKLHEVQNLVATGFEPGNTYYVRAVSRGVVSNTVEVIIPPEKMKDSGGSGGTCMYKGRTYKLMEEFYDGCEAFCTCTEIGTHCATIECPTDFALDVLDPTCISWEHPPDFVPSPPRCCPDRVICKDNGSCTYAGERFDNWAEIPHSITGCEQQCFCEFGNVTCQNMCAPVPATPPSDLQCPGSQPFLGHMPGEDCCLHWMCRPTKEQGHNDSTDSNRTLHTTSKPSELDNSGLPHPTAMTMLKNDSNTTAKNHLGPFPWAVNTERVPFQPTVIPMSNIRNTESNIFHTQFRNMSKQTLAPEISHPEEDLVEKPTISASMATINKTAHIDHGLPADEYFLGPLVPQHPTVTRPWPPLVIKGSKVPQQDISMDQKHIPDYPSHEYSGPDHPGSEQPGPEHPVIFYYPQHPGALPHHPGAISHHPGALPPQHVGHDDAVYTHVPPELSVPNVPPAKRPTGIPVSVRPQDRRPEGVLHIQSEGGNPPDEHIEEIISHLQQQGVLPPNYSIKHATITNKGRPDAEEVLIEKLQHQGLLPQHYHLQGRPDTRRPTGTRHPLPPHNEEELILQLQQQGLLPSHLPVNLILNQTHSGFPGAAPPPGFVPPHASHQPDSVTVLTLEAVDEHTVRLVFAVPPVLVGLHGRVELRYTSDARNNDVRTWQQQILAPPDDLIATPQLEFELAGLEPDTLYKIQITVMMRDIHTSPNSQILTVKTPPAYPQTTFPPTIPVDPKLSVTEVNSTWMHLIWRKFSDFELQFIDGVQIRYKEIDDKIYSATPLIHRSVTNYTIEDLKPQTKYEVGIFFIPFPGQTTELQAENTIQVTTSEEQDAYRFDIKLEVHNVKSTSVEITWSGVPYPEDKFVNIFRVIYQSESGKEDFNTFKIAKRDSQAKTLIKDLKPGIRYRLWLEVYLTNGKIKKSNVQDFITKPGSASGVAQKGKLERSPQPVTDPGDYYGPLVGVAIIAALAIVAALILLLILVRKYGQNKAAISASRKSQSAYDNPSYKVEIQQETMDL